MKPRQIAQLLVNIGEVVNLTRNVNIHKDAVTTHLATMREVRVKLDKYQEMYSNQEYMKTLSPAESQVLIKNAQDFYKTHTELQKELEYLDMSRQPVFVANAQQELDKAYLLLEYLSEFVGKNGETILPHLTALKVKFFPAAKYPIQIEGLFYELEAETHDFLVDHVQATKEVTLDPEYPMLIPIFGHLALATCWLKKEKERLASEALPEIRKIEVPVESAPEIPAGPEGENIPKGN